MMMKSFKSFYIFPATKKETFCHEAIRTRRLSLCFLFLTPSSCKINKACPTSPRDKKRGSRYFCSLWWSIFISNAKRHATLIESFALGGTLTLREKYEMKNAKKEYKNHIAAPNSLEIKYFQLLYDNMFASA
jgi:hypothetical protein